MRWQNHSVHWHRAKATTGRSGEPFPQGRGNPRAKRAFDLALAVILAPIIVPVALLVAIAVKIADPGPVLYWSDRVGADNRLFSMPKFRTMKIGTPVLATHLLADPCAALTPVGNFLRTTSLDEIPQMLPVFRGQMSFVGPRPALYNQQDLIALRTAAGVSGLVPGITGWAQVNGRDDLPIPVKVALDSEYAHCQSLLFDLKILARTAIKVLRRDGVVH